MRIRIDGAPHLDLEINRGTNRPIAFTLKDSAGVAIDITGYTGKFDWSDGPGEPIALAWTFSIVNASLGKFQFSVNQSDLINLPAESYEADMWIIDNSGVNRKLFEADIDLLPLVSELT